MHDLPQTATCQVRVALISPVLSKKQGSATGWAARIGVSSTQQSPHHRWKATQLTIFLVDMHTRPHGEIKPDRGRSKSISETRGNILSRLHTFSAKMNHDSLPLRLDSTPRLHLDQDEGTEDVTDGSCWRRFTPNHDASHPHLVPRQQGDGRVQPVDPGPAVGFPLAKKNKLLFI
ncbi:uncharacterized protein K441DRAFT_700642 [Cenococcum geophilum 1.58]|uniref:Uncharacterized protein n=1 Tax=Cenococcum geophilum 1.58 TaxID=794803 RepID=A0ACC8EPU4_9PEZI|nr:hypothetical protein K441DRAFT_700642 [Cenococcum geophilum 1.58]